MSDEKSMGQVIQIDEAQIRDHLGEMVRGTVEETLNAMLDDLEAKGPALRCRTLRAQQEPDRIHGPAAMSGHCRPAPARSISRFQNCGARPSRRPSFNAIAGGRLFGRGSADRDVFGGDFSSARGGHHRGPLGHAGKSEHRSRTSTRRSTPRSKPGGTGGSKVSIHIFISTAL